MQRYRLVRRHGAGSLSVVSFESIDDDDAVTCGLRMRTNERCDLYRADLWLATFDCASRQARSQFACANDDFYFVLQHRPINTETEASYFYRHALEQRALGQNSASSSAALAHLDTADYLESLARAVEAEQRRRLFYDVNGSHETRTEPKP